MPKRGENIYKRKDGRWEGRYIRGRTASGQAEYGYVYADSYKACRAKRQQCIETLPEKPAVQASAATLAQAAELFLSEKSHVLKASSWNRYSYLTQHYILPALGTAPICQLTADQISDFPAPLAAKRTIRQKRQGHRRITKVNSEVYSQKAGLQLSRCECRTARLSPKKDRGIFRRRDWAVGKKGPGSAQHGGRWGPACAECRSALGGAMCAPV